jgi:SAM-dependent methyltransferase
MNMGEAQHIDWDSFPVHVISRRTFAKRNLIHANLLLAALRRARGSVLEIGVGSGAQSALLSRVVDRTCTVDNNHRILNLAGQNIRRFGRDVQVVAADAFRLPFMEGAFGVGVSQGLMEHFSNEEIAELLQEQLRVCRAVVFSVPSNHYPRQDLGNERLLTPAEWTTIARHAVGTDRYKVAARYYRADLEALKYSALAHRWLGAFSVLVTIDRR